MHSRDLLKTKTISASGGRTEDLQLKLLQTWCAAAERSAESNGAKAAEGGGPRVGNGGADGGGRGTTDSRGTET